jgi:hypothetical protein
MPDDVYLDLTATTNYYGRPVFTNPYREQDKQSRKNERGEMRRFMGEGHADGFELVLDEQSNLWVFGYNYMTLPNRTICRIDTVNNKLCVVKKRTSHIRSLLNELADRESLEVVFGELGTYSGGTTVAHWAFKNPPEVDDTELVSQSQLVDRSQRSGRLVVDEYIEQLRGRVTANMPRPQFIAHNDVPF